MRLFASFIFLLSGLVFVISGFGVVAELTTSVARQNSTKINAGNNTQASFVYDAAENIQAKLSFSPNQRELKKSLITLRLFQYDQMRQRAAVADPVVQKKLRENLIALVEDFLSEAPTSSNHWLLLSILRAQANDPQKKIIDALNRSYWMGPHEGWISGRRLKLAASFWTSFEEEQKIYAQKDVKALMPINFKEVVRDVYQASNADIKALIRQELAKQSSTHSKRLLKKLL